MEAFADKACCADLYRSDLARLILGDTLHPGGLALTHRLGRLMDIRPGYWVADLASGPGASAMAISRVFRCKVVGVEFGLEATAEAASTARSSVFPPAAFFLQGDAESLPLRSSSFDAAICECSLSVFPDKARTVREALRVLRPGGVLGISDVTLEPGCLPEELDGVIARVLCLAGALSAQGYTRLLEENGFQFRKQEDASGKILDLLDDIDGKIGVLAAWLGPSGADPDQAYEFVNKAPAITAKLRQLVNDGRLGYALFVGQKPR